MEKDRVFNLMFISSIGEADQVALAINKAMVLNNRNLKALDCEISDMRVSGKMVPETNLFNNHVADVIGRDD